MRVFAFNQIDLPVTLPLLDLPFPDQHGLKAFVGFEPHETVHAVFGGKAGDGSCFVLPNAAREFEGRTDVESPIPVAVVRRTSWVPARRNLSRRSAAAAKRSELLERFPIG